MFFQNLNKLLKSVNQINIAIAPTNDGNKISVTFLAKAKENKLNLTTNVPFLITGTPEEIDTEFASLIQTIEAPFNKSFNNIEQAANLIQKAEDEAQKKLNEKTAKKKKTPSAKPSPAQPDLLNMNL